MFQPLKWTHLKEVAEIFLNPTVFHMRVIRPKPLYLIILFLYKTINIIVKDAITFSIAISSNVSHHKRQSNLPQFFARHPQNINKIQPFIYIFFFLSVEPEN